MEPMDPPTAVGVRHSVYSRGQDYITLSSFLHMMTLYTPQSQQLHLLGVLDWMMKLVMKTWQ